MDAMVRSAQYAVQGPGQVDAAQLNPQFQYIKVTTRGRSAFLALGNREQDRQGVTEVWYSAQREVLRLRNGRLAGAVGTTTEWRNVTLPDLPTWAHVAASSAPFEWTRVRDVMPGYRYGVRDKLSLRKIAAPSRSALQNSDAQALTWFEERMAGDTGGAWTTKLLSHAKTDLLPPARYAVDLRGGKEIVVYGEQCLAADLCFTWQRWDTKSAGGVHR